VYFTGHRNVLTSVSQGRLFRKGFLDPLIRWHNMESGARRLYPCAVALLRIWQRSSPIRSQCCCGCSTRASGEPNFNLGHVSSASPVNNFNNLINCQSATTPCLHDCDCQFFDDFSTSLIATGFPCLLRSAPSLATRSKQQDRK